MSHEHITRDKYIQQLQCVRDNADASLRLRSVVSTIIDWEPVVDSFYKNYSFDTWPATPREFEATPEQEESKGANQTLAIENKFVAAQASGLDGAIKRGASLSMADRTALAHVSFDPQLVHFITIQMAT